MAFAQVVHAHDCVEVTMSSCSIERIRTTTRAACLCLALASAAASASPALTSFTGGNSFPAFNGTNQTIGWSFTVAPGAGITVNSLGYYDPTAATPLGQTHQVGIWDLSGLLLGSATVQTTGALTGSFRYGAVTPIILVSGTTYVIGAAITSPFSDPYVSGASALVTDAAIVFGGSSRSASSSGFAAPLILDGAVGRFGPNFDFTVNATQGVPEPSPLWLGLAGLAMLALARKRRDTSASISCG